MGECEREEREGRVLEATELFDSTDTLIRRRRGSVSGTDETLASLLLGFHLLSKRLLSFVTSALDLIPLLFRQPPPHP